MDEPPSCLGTDVFYGQLLTNLRVAPGSIPFHLPPRVSNSNYLLTGSYLETSNSYVAHSFDVTSGFVESHILFQYWALIAQLKGCLLAVSIGN